ncbi:MULTISPECIES: glycerophosphoryl diester phosphodiesterase membrane domain-containing protein [unclassified Streptomyces]|uniref:glycerophosphoryl diester phosphodiesterase membrane domain-containing protein n=1 Tax=unclassified Streptomyces TaxID=2593676 RepID=UPI00278C39B8|nr:MULTISPECIES: glycerophosphoryl diester phosphodiesterase membrane domain-containing protein [unclassified Streptomyces]
MNDTPGWASPGSAPSDGPDGNRKDGTGHSGENGDTQGSGPQNAAPQDAAPQDAAGQSPKWSKDQPPPAQWSAPSDSGQTPPPPPPPAPGQGWGGQGGNGGYGQGPGGGWGGGTGYPGWGGGWQGRPAAAKPGVIPLRPLGVGEILDGAVSTMRTYWRTVLGISLTVAVVTQLLTVLLQGFVLNDAASSSTLDDPDATAREVFSALGSLMIGSLVVAVITLLGTIVATALLTTVTSRAVLGRPVTIGEAWRDARPQLLRLLGLTLLLPLIAVVIMLVSVAPGILVGALGSPDGGIALGVIGGLAGFVVTIWLMIRLSLASPALMLEKQPIWKAMGRSTKLVRGSWWRVFGITILASLIAAIVSEIILVPFTVLAGAVSGDGFSSLLDSGGSFGWAFLIITGIGSVIGSTITFPITAGVTVLLYIDRRIRREALDLELARAAGLQDYGSASGGTPGS